MVCNASAVMNGKLIQSFQLYCIKFAHLRSFKSFEIQVLCNQARSQAKTTTQVLPSLDFFNAF